MLTELQEAVNDLAEGQSRGPGMHGGFLSEQISTGPRAGNARTVDRRVQIALVLMAENLLRKLVIQDIAALVNLSPGRLAHLFKDEMGVSLQQYLTQLRLAKARHRLESTFLSIKEIAASVGFASVTQFTNSFKSVHGTTPSEYRKLPRPVSPRRKDLAIARSAND